MRPQNLTPTDSVGSIAGEESRGSIGADGDVLDSAVATGLLVRGGVFRFAGYGGQVVLAVAAAAVLTRHLGVARFGQYTTVMSLVALVAAVTDAGMSSIGTREYAVLSGSERDAMMRDLLGLRVVLTVVGVLLATAFAVVAGYDDPLLLGTIAASLATIPLVFQHTLAIPLTTDLRLGALSALELTRQVVSVGAIIVLASLGAGVFPLLAVPLLANLALIPPTVRLVRDRISPRLVLRPAGWPPLLMATLVFSLATAVGTIYIYTAQILTSLVTSRHQSGLFAVSFRVFVVSAVVPGMLAAAALPVLSRAARDDADRLAYGLQRMFEAALIGGVGAALVLSTGSKFVVAVIAGPRYAGSAAVLSIQAFALIASSLVACWSFGLLALRLHRGLLAANAAALVVSVVATLVLARSDGAQGAAVATLCGESTLAAAALIALVWHCPHYRPGARVVIKVAVAGVPAALLATVPNMPSVIRAIVAASTYAAVILATRALPSEINQLIPAQRPRR